MLDVVLLDVFGEVLEAEDGLAFVPGAFHNTVGFEDVCGDDGATGWTGEGFDAHD